jgi:hypothetical protein
MPSTRTARLLESWEHHAKVICGDQDNRSEIIGLGTGEEFEDSISDLEDLSPVEPSATETHANIISGINDDTPDFDSSNCGRSQRRSIVDNNHDRHGSCETPSHTDIEDSFY